MGSPGYGGWCVGICSVDRQPGDVGGAGAAEAQRQSAQEFPLEQEGQPFIRFRSSAIGCRAPTLWRAIYFTHSSLIRC